MFLEIPVLWETEDEDIIEVRVDINPFHIISIEPINRQRCNICLSGEIVYEATLSRTKVKKLVSEFMRENILSKVYKQMKDDSSHN